MRVIDLLLFSELACCGLASATPDPRGDAFCRAKTANAGSYCKFYQNPPVCHGSSFDCSTSSIELYFTSAPNNSQARESGPSAARGNGLANIETIVSNIVSVPWIGITLGQRDAHCQRVTGNRGSYCKVRHDQDYHVCHGLDADCSQRTVYEALQALTLSIGTVPTSTTVRTSTATRPATSRITRPAITTTTTTRPATSRITRPAITPTTTTRPVITSTTTTRAAITTTTTTRPATSRITRPAITTTTTTRPAITSTTTTRAATSSITRPAISTTRTTGEATATTTRAGTTLSSTTRAPQTSPRTSQGDPCEFAGALMLGHSATSGDSYFMKPNDLRACLQSTKISHANALWTLHNLYYGVAETYSFTDIAVDSLNSVHRNVCGFKLHEVSVDLVGEISSQISNYNDVLSPLGTSEVDAYLAQERPAYEFHANLLRMMNNLHDAHTLYSTPYEMFRVYAPFNFGARMVNGRQVVTLRYTTHTSDPVGRLARIHERLFGSIPFPENYNGKIVSQINGIEALTFLLQLVADNAPLGASYQQAEQRLNANFFSAPLLVFGLTLSLMPDFDSLTLKFSDGIVKTANLLGQFADLSTSPYYSVPSLRSSTALSSYMHSNPAFNAFINHEENASEMRSSLWKSASSAARAPIASHLMSSTGGHHRDRWLQLSKRHKALLCPVKNYLRDHILNVPVEDNDRSRFAEAAVLARVIKAELERGGGITGTSSSSSFTQLPNGLSFSIRSDVVVVRVPSMVPEPESDNDETFYFFPDFVKIQQAAKRSQVTRILFDVTNNGGGYVMSAYALLWYVMADPVKACAPLRKRVTANWDLWINSFGDGLHALVDRYLTVQGEALADKIDAIFKEISSLVTLMYEGLGLTFDDLGSVTKNVALARVTAAKASILAKASKADRARAILNYIKTRGFIPPDAPVKDQMMPVEGFTPFDFTELCRVKSELEYFTNPNSIYKQPEFKSWGRPSAYSQPGLYAFCFSTLQQMPQVAVGYQTGYWTQVAFVSDGTCGSACALFTQALQTNGDAVAFSYGGVANKPLDVASFAGGNVEEYSSFWPSLAFAAKIGHLASGGQAPWSLAHHRTWVASPIAFPTRATARFNWNMMFASAMGPNALPRQFYLIPARKHLNIWTASEDGLSQIYSEISSIQNWASIPAQFASSHGQCPGEVVPFSVRPPVHVY